jgi:hypothetical protein
LLNLRRQIIGVLAAVLLLALAVVGSARPELQPIPSVMLAVNGVIDGFGMDGSRFVYAGGRAPDIGGCPSVELGSFGSKVHRRLAPEVLGAPGGDSCNAYDLPLQIALGDTRAVWGGFVDCCNSAYGSVTTGAPGTKPRDVDGIGQLYHGTDGDFLTGVAGDGRSLVYAIVTVEVVRNVDGCFPATEPPPGVQTCDFKVTKWKVNRVVGRRAIRVHNAPPSALIDVSGNQIALVPADRRLATCNAESLGSCLEPRALRRFEIRSLDGSLLTRQSLNGTPTAIAVSDGFVAVLVKSGGSAHIDRYDSRSGALIGRAPVPVATADEIGISGRKIVYRVKKVIRILDARSGVQTSLAVAKANPIGLGIEGGRVAWAENVKRRGRIMSLISPG